MALRLQSSLLHFALATRDLYLLLQHLQMPRPLPLCPPECRNPQQETRFVLLLLRDSTLRIFNPILRVLNSVLERLTPMARSNSPTLGHPKFPQAGRPDYDDSGVMAMRAAASLRR